MKISNQMICGAFAGFLLVGSYFAGYFSGAKTATREVEARVDTEHQQAVEDVVVCKLSLALTQGRLQRFEQVESEQLQSCCAGE